MHSHHVTIFMKKTSLAIISPGFYLLLALLVACEGSQQQPTESSMDTPEQKQAQSRLEASAVLEEFIDASIARQYSRYYDLLSEQDQAVKSRDDFIQEKAPQGVTLADAFYDRIQYRIESIQVDADRAEALVNYRYPNVEFMIKDMFGLSILSDFTDAEIVDMKQRLEQAYQEKPLPMKTSSRKFVLLKQAPGWRVSLGWKKSVAGNP